jgi:hypothetical protein
LSGCTWKNGQLGFEYRKPFDLIAEFERAEKTRKQKTQHSNRSGDGGREIVQVNKSPGTKELRRSRLRPGSGAHRAKRPKMKTGSPGGIRTPVTAVKGRRLRPG